MYVRQRTNREKDVTDRIASEKRTERNECVLAWGTVGVAIGAIGLVLWEMYSHFYQSPCH